MWYSMLGKNQLEKKSLLIYFVIILLEAIFYLIADFGKILTVGYGMVLLIICFVLFILIYKNSKKFISFIIITLTILQLPPIPNWIIWSGSRFGFLGNLFNINVIGAIYHILILLSGVYILVKKSKI